MRVRPEAGRGPPQARVDVVRRVDEREPDAQERPAEDPVLLVEQELRQRLVRLVVGERERRREVLDDARLQLARDE